MVKLLFVLTLMLAPPLARADDITLTNGEWRPYLSEALPHQGVLSRIVTEAFALEGVTVHYVFRPWPRAYAEARQGVAQGSIVWSGGAPGSTRKRDFLFSDVVYEEMSVFFHRKDVVFNWSSFPDLLNYRVGGVAGYEYQFENIPGMRIDRAANDELCMRKLLAGRFDIFPASLGVGLDVLRERLTPAEAAQITWHPGAYNKTRYHLILSREFKRAPHYAALFNKGLKRLKDSGRYAEYLADLGAKKQ
jgi:polar amino acid transport system substrate-binding protein